MTIGAEAASAQTPFVQLIKVAAAPASGEEADAGYERRTG